jgi:hypothetical protein
MSNGTKTVFREVLRDLLRAFAVEVFALCGLSALFRDNIFLYNKRRE